MDRLLLYTLENMVTDTDDRRNNVEALRLIGEAGKCKRLESQQEQAAFNMRVSSMMCG